MDRLLSIIRLIKLKSQQMDVWKQRRATKEKPLQIFSSSKLTYRRTLENAGGGNYRLDAEGLGVPVDEIVTGIPAEAVTLHTRSLEASNVNFAQEMTRMIESQRAYSLNSQSITLGDQMMGLINSMRS